METYRSAVMPWLARHRVLLDVAITVVGVAVVAMVGLVIEDVNPAPGEDSSASTAGRIIWSGVLICLLMGLVAVRQWLARYGTLFYVRLLPDNMADWHEAEAAAKERGYHDLRVVTRSFPAAEGGVDIVDEVRDLSRVLQAEMDGDRTDTGTELVPNMVLPVSLAAGFDLFWFPGMTLFEADNGLQWALDTTIRAHDERTIATLGETVRSWDLPIGGHDSLHEADPLGPIVIQAELTGAETATTPMPFPVSQHVLVGVMAAAENGVTSTPVRVSTDPPQTRTVEGQAEIHPVAGAYAVCNAIRSALHEAGDRVVIVTGRMPKTVAVAVGWLLANNRGKRLNDDDGSPGVADRSGQPGEHVDHTADPGCGDPDCRAEACWRPWTRLITPYWDGRAYVWARVHPSQSLGAAQPPFDAPRPTVQRLINLTPHPLVLYDGNEIVLTVPPTGDVARVPEAVALEPSVGVLDATVPTVAVTYDTDRLAPPPRISGTHYIVSRTYAEAVQRDDLRFPYDEVRDTTGRIIGCRSLAQFRGRA